ncbi:MAG: winged helix-turn-helix domain-containing protein [Gammaproteobacteria bacterium]|nr:winged helix-turn-helix domain-containing protein [Gammaproteobacteria bacterium]MDH5653460.1 winged helix-turn-helix domain-containing protein [Gammaproteobacteria bacterium]
MQNETQTLSGQAFWLDDWYVDPASGRISRAGAEVKLEPKVMMVLELLAARPGEVISRETIEATAWEGVVVGYDALSTTIIKLRKALGDDSRQPRYIETVSKKGYRLIAAVSHAGKPAGVTRTTGAGLRHAKQRLAVYLGIGLLAVVVAAYLGLRGNDAPPQGQSDTASLVVLPFTNRNDDKSQDYFSDGITDDLINDLSLYSGLRVIARRSAYIYKQRQSDIQTIARELAVNYVLDGDVRRDQDRLRVNVQLINARTGVNIWAQRFDRQTSDIFKVQDDIRKNILDALSVTLTREEQKRAQRRYTHSFAAYDLFLKGQAGLITRASAGDSEKAQQFMEQAIALDPEFARAHSALALIHADNYRFDWTTNPEHTRQLALFLGKRGVELDSHSPQAHWILGYIYLFLFEDHTVAVNYAQQAAELAPNDPDGFNTLAVIHAFGDNPERARQITTQIMQQHPRYSALVPSVLGLANLRLQNYTEAIAAYDKSLLINPSRIQSNIYKALALYRMGNMDDARWQLDQLYTMHPNFDLNVWAKRQPYQDKRIIQAIVADLQALRSE